MKRLITLCVIALGIYGPVFAAPARTDAEIRAAIDEVLQQRHPKDTGEWWRALGPTAPAVIMKMATDTGHPYVKMRLIGALGHFPEDAAAQAFLKDQGQTATDDVIRHAAIRSVGRAQGEAALEWIAQFLEDKNTQTRLTAAETIQKIGGDAAAARLAAYLKKEKVPWIAKRLEGQVVPAGTLKVTGSNDERLADDWFGVWKGQWIEVKGSAALRAELRAERKSPTEWTGTLTVFHPKKQEALRIPRAIGKASRVTGVFSIGTGKETSEEAFEAEIWAARTGSALILRSAARSGVFIGSERQ